MLRLVLLALVASSPSVPIVARAAPPDPNTVLRKSVTAMTTAHSVHSDGRILSTNPYGAADWYSTSDCQAATHTAGASQRIRAWTRGHEHPRNRNQERIDMHFVAITPGTEWRFWERSRITENRWRKATELQLAAASSAAYLCPVASPETLASADRGAGARVSLKRVGTVNGRATRLLRIVAGDTGVGLTESVDLDIDQVTGYWLRYTFRQTVASGTRLGPARYVATFTYSAFNQPIHIVPPAIGSSTP
jgi:hypothetical protein